jgi:ubiquinone/menaquinone biosynthesis C-methylase UbiE
MTGAPRSFDRVADCYDETRGGEERGQRFAEELEPLFASKGLTLEIGIGTGVVAKGFNGLGRHVVGIDIAPLMLRRAVERIGPRVCVANAECLPVTDESVDDAYSVWVLHLVDVAAVMAEVTRVLRDGGRYVVTPPGEVDPDPISDIIRPMYDVLRGAAGRRDDADRIAAIAEAAGLGVVRSFEGAPQRFTETPAAIATQIETRGGSALWDVDDETWERVVVPAIDALRALPDPDLEIERVSRPRILVLER